MPNQNDVCLRFKVEPVPSELSEKLGIAIETIGRQPINGMRVNRENGTCGWYIWCGEDFSENSEFFKPLHVGHINEYLPEVTQYLSLPPGYRFLIANEYEDVWFDSQLVSK